MADKGKRDAKEATDLRALVGTLNARADALQAQVAAVAQAMQALADAEAALKAHRTGSHLDVSSRAHAPPAAHHTHCTCLLIVKSNLTRVGETRRQAAQQDQVRRQPEGGAELG